VYNVVKSMLKYLLKGSVVTFDIVIKKFLLSISNIYFSLFEFLLRFLRNFGVFGELLFTVFGLIWLLWPLLIAYYLSITEVWISSVILTIVLIVRGR